MANFPKRVLVSISILVVGYLTVSAMAEPFMQKSTSFARTTTSDGANRRLTSSLGGSVGASDPSYMVSGAISSYSNLSMTLVDQYARIGVKLAAFAWPTREPLLVTARQILRDVQLSLPCREGLLRMSHDLYHKKPWAMKTLDASGKVTNGLRDKYVDFGSIDQCLANGRQRRKSRKTLNNQSMPTKYCLTKIRWPLPAYEGHPPKLQMSTVGQPNGLTHWIQAIANHYEVLYVDTFTVAACLPATCARDEIQVNMKFFNR